jgi:hypothetical protein
MEVTVDDLNRWLAVLDEASKQYPLIDMETHKVRDEMRAKLAEAEAAIDTTIHASKSKK